MESRGGGESGGGELKRKAILENRSGTRQRFTIYGRHWFLGDIVLQLKCIHIRFKMCHVVIGKLNGFSR